MRSARRSRTFVRPCRCTSRITTWCGCIGRCASPRRWRRACRIGCGRWTSWWSGHRYKREVFSKMSSFDDPEMSYRRGYEHGASQLFEEIAHLLPEAVARDIKGWIFHEIHTKWRLPNLTGKTG